MTAGTTHDGGASSADPHRGAGEPRLRASDADRAATVRVLQEAVAHGLLTADEGSDRMATAFAARFRDELPAVTVDLPLTAPPVPAVAGWHALGAGLVAQVRHEVRATGRAGVRSRRFVAAVLAIVLLLGFLVALFSLAVQGLDHGGPLDGVPAYGQRGR